MKSKDWIDGYTDAMDMMQDRLRQALKEMDKFGDRQSFKGMSKREVVDQCRNIVNELIKTIQPL